MKGISTKWRLPISEALPIAPRRRFDCVNSGYRCAVNRTTSKDLKKYAPAVSEQIFRDETFLAVFGRVVRIPPRNRGMRCYQYLYVWDGQRFPRHPMDYEPVFVYVSRYDNPTTVLFDKLHYKIGRYLLDIDSKIVLKVKRPWHEFEITELYARNMNSHYPIAELTDDHLMHWWNFMNNDAKLKIRENFMDPLALMGVNNFSARSPPVVPNLKDQIILSLSIPFSFFKRNSESSMEFFQKVIQNLIIPLREENRQNSIILDAGLAALIYQGAKYGVFKVAIKDNEILREFDYVKRALDSNISIGDMLLSRDVGIFHDFVTHFNSKLITLDENEESWSELQGFIGPDEDEDLDIEIESWIEEYERGEIELSIIPEFMQLTEKSKRQPLIHLQESISGSEYDKYEGISPLISPRPFQEVVRLGGQSPEGLMQYLIELAESPWTDEPPAELDGELDPRFASSLFVLESQDKKFLHVISKFLKDAKQPWIIIEATAYLLKMIPNDLADVRQLMLDELEKIFARVEQELTFGLHKASEPWKILTSISNFEYFLRSKRISQVITEISPTIAEGIKNGWVPETQAKLLMRFGAIRSSSSIERAIRKRNIGNELNPEN